MDCCSILLGDERAGRLEDYKTRSVICDQEGRRLQLLADQKRRREKTFNDHRNIDLLCGWGNDDLGGLEGEVKECTEAIPKRHRLKDMFMLSEWMITVPDNFDTKWMFALCPLGKRCLVRSTKGYTSVYGKRGERLATFQSALPNGCQRNMNGCRYSNSEVTIIDCIWSSDYKCYFVLDLLSWKGQLYMETDMSFRAFWIKSKLEETPALSERSEQNSYPFISLDYHPCDFFTISSAISKQPFQTLGEPKIDGIIFYHSEAHYTPGPTPLVLWLKPFMVPEILNITIPDFYCQMKPSSYIDMQHYIMEYEERQSKKKKKQRKCRRTSQIDEESEEINMLVS